MTNLLASLLLIDFPVSQTPGSHILKFELLHEKSLKIKMNLGNLEDQQGLFDDKTQLQKSHAMFPLRWQNFVNERVFDCRRQTDLLYC